MKENRMLPIGTETFRIFVDEAEDGVIRGRVSGGTFPEETLFRSLSRLILLLEEQLDTGGAPKASPIKCTETPTFELDILFRQNYSWQGRLRWTKGGKEAAFRSVLELLFRTGNSPILAERRNSPLRYIPAHCCLSYRDHFSHRGYLHA